MHLAIFKQYLKIVVVSGVVSDDLQADNVVINTWLVSCLLFILLFSLFIPNQVFMHILNLSFLEASKVETGLSLSVSPVSVEFIRKERTSDSCYSISHRAENKILCAVGRSVEIRSADLTLEKKINIPGGVLSAQLIAGGRLITKVCDYDNKKYRTYIGTETDPQQTLLHEVKFVFDRYISLLPPPLPLSLSRTSASDNRMAVIDSVNKQLRVYSAAGDHQFDISLTDMKSPRGVHLLPDDSAVLVTDRDGGELRKYPLTAAAKPVWRCGGLEKPTGVTTDESGLIYVCSGKKIYLISDDGLYNHHPVIYSLIIIIILFSKNAILF